MEHERWLKVERLYHSARERGASERAQFLSEACAGDETLRREVESLLAQGENSGSFLATPAMEVAAQALARDQASEQARTASTATSDIRTAGGQSRSYDVAPDDKRSLVLSAQESASVPITLVVNWAAGLKRQ